MEAIINFFTPGFHNFCGLIWGKDLTEVWSEQTGLPWTRVHEHIIAWLALFLVLSVTLNIILGIKLRKVRCAG